MKKIKLPGAVSRKFYKVGFQLKKHSPEILAVAGTVGIVTSTVMACKATTKVGLILDTTKDTVEKIHEGVEKQKLKEDGTVYTKEDSKKDLAVVYTQTGVKLIKLYAPAVTIGTLSVISMLTSNNILRKRYMASVAAYAAVDNSFKDYRNRVIQRFGKELDRELKYDIKAQEIEETVIDENGKEKTVKKTVEVIDPNKISEYAKFFDESCPDWTKNPEDNFRFLKMQQSYANDKLHLQGYLFLNDVYEMCGIPKTAAGQIVGWIYDEKNPTGDNFVDFGLFDGNKEETRLFVNGHERTFLIDPNVDGEILHNFRRA